MVFTDASATGWGATYNGHAVSGVWTGPQLHWHINCLEFQAVRLTLSRLKRAPSGQGRYGPYGQYCDRCIYQPARQFTHSSHVATHPPPSPLESEASEVPSCHPHPGSVQSGSQSSARATLPGERRLHPQGVQLICGWFGIAQVDLFASPETTSQWFYSLTKATLSTDALANMHSPK